jgi:hypothetical protein
MSKRETCDVVWCVSLRAAVQANNAARRRAEKEAQRLEEERLKQANSGRK